MSDWTAFDRLLVSRRRAMVESFVEFLRLPSVSQEPEKVRATGEWLASAMRARRLGGRAEDGVPMTPFADIGDDALAEFRLYARGASDDKGPIWSHLNAIDLMDAVGIASKVNVKFIFDGEEEIGSPFFGVFCDKHRELLAADVVIITDGPKHASG